MKWKLSVDWCRRQLMLEKIVDVWHRIGMNEEQLFDF